MSFYFLAKNHLMDKNIKFNHLFHCMIHELIQLLLGNTYIAFLMLHVKSVMNCQCILEHSSMGFILSSKATYINWNHDFFSQPVMSFFHCIFIIIRSRKLHEIQLYIHVYQFDLILFFEM